MGGRGKMAGGARASACERSSTDDKIIASLRSPLKITINNNQHSMVAVIGRGGTRWVAFLRRARERGERVDDNDG